MQVWNSDLAEIAQAHSERCMFAFNSQRENGPIFSSVGENIAIAMGAIDYASYVNGWTSEASDFDIQTGFCLNSCTQWTQVLYTLLSPRSGELVY
jgi:hypothetical protein